MRDSVINEADTCREFITPRLVEAGWGPAPHAIGEQSSSTNGRIVVAGGKVRRGKQKRADYLLYYRRDYPLAVVEAKEIGDKQLGNPAYGRIRAGTFGSLVDTANARLLKLRNVLVDRYGGFSTDDLLNRVFSLSAQEGLGM